MEETKVTISRYIALIVRPTVSTTQHAMSRDNALTLLRPVKTNAAIMAQLRALMPGLSNHLSDDEVLTAIATQVAQGNMVLSDTSLCDDANNNRSRFFEQMPGIRALAKQLNVPEDYMVGLASYESGWFDDHNVKLNNLWGLTQGGGNNIPFSSIQAGNAYFAKRVGPSIQGAQTIDAFFAGLKKEGYNSANPDYFSTDMKKGKLYNRIVNIAKWERKCGVA